MQARAMEYAGFWVRVGAALIDTVLVVLVLFPVLTLIYGSGYWAGDNAVRGFWDFVLNYVLPAIAIVLFWIHKSATPGKMALRLVIRDADTGERPTTGQCIKRYLGYYVSIIPFLLGLVWVGIDARKQGWHDKLANTVVVHRPRRTSGGATR